MRKNFVMANFFFSKTHFLGLFWLGRLNFFQVFFFFNLGPLGRDWVCLFGPRRELGKLGAFFNFFQKKL